MRRAAIAAVQVGDLMLDPGLASRAAPVDAARLLAEIAVLQARLGSAQAVLISKLVSPSPAPSTVAAQAAPPAPYLRAGDIVRRFGVCRATLWKWRRQGLFPEPVSLGPNVCAWPAEVIQDWERQAAERMPRVAGTGQFQTS